MKRTDDLGATNLKHCERCRLKGIVFDMSENDRMTWRNRRARTTEQKRDFSLLPFPKDGNLTVKNIAYLHVYCRMPPELIAARSKASLADVYLGLCHYHRNPKPVDAEIRREMEFNRRDSLGDASMSLPRVGLGSLVETLRQDKP